MIDHARKALDLRLVLRQLAPVELDVSVPAERMRPGHELMHDIETVFGLQSRSHSFLVE